jgi:hypothetical protein
MPVLPSYQAGQVANPIGIDEARRVVYHILRSGFDLLKEDQGWLDRVFSQLSKSELGSIKKWLYSRRVNVIHGFARKDSNLPLVSIMVLNETNAQSYLNDHLRIEDSGLDPAYLGEVSSFKPQKAIVSGARVNAQLEVWVYDESPDTVNYLYRICWVLIHCARDILGARGITAGEMSGGDVRPDPKFLPDFLYVRRIVCPVEGDRAYAAADDLIRELTVRANVLLEVPNA